MKHITSGRIAGALIAAAFFTSPMAMASDHGDHHRGKHDIAEMCENMREGKGRFNDEKRQEKLDEHRNEMANRLKLTAEQREIWDDIHEERREKRRARMEKWQEKMEKRCERMENRTSGQ
ncbi:hypothetical protein [Marinobacter sp.]|jgi:Spy/CpxP family protein refolding chaperone|uniref:hypothetical protein n=1 Tax=Marinobacter sp. TaxID=50741 RepID=UPI003B52E594|tara:strand:- start:581 stop:940 length:360 start_codon:yes stop_codon:yes gene_type:complete